jgi:hypothetical protein
MRYLPMATPEIQKYMLYNNGMYTVASHLIEVKTGKPFSAFLQERFFDPLNMTSTFLQPSSAIASGHGERIASGHQFNESSGKWNIFDAYDSPEAQGAGSIITSTADYIKYVRAMLHSSPPISQSSREALTRPRILIEVEDKQADPFCSPPLYCLGWGTYYYCGHQVVMHEGLIDGFGSSHLFLPAHDFGAVILGNSDGAEQISWILARELIDAALDVPEVERPDWAALQARKLDKDNCNAGDKVLELRESLSSAQGSEQPVPGLDFFVGRYSNPGYGDLEVKLKDTDLYIDATDRNFPCNFTFEHVRTWQNDVGPGPSMRTNIIANLIPTRGSLVEHLASQFVWDSCIKATRMGILLEDTLSDDEMIWFKRV